MSNLHAIASHYLAIRLRDLCTKELTFEVLKNNTDIIVFDHIKNKNKTPIGVLHCHKEYNCTVVLYLENGNIWERKMEIPAIIKFLGELAVGFN